MRLLIKISVSFGSELQDELTTWVFDLSGTNFKRPDSHHNGQASTEKSGSFTSTAYNEFRRVLMHQALDRGELPLVALLVDVHTVGIE